MTTMPDSSYQARRRQVESYFDRTAAEAWKRLTSDAPVSGIRATVRAGRDRMRATLLEWLPADLTGLRLLDAGCGTGLLAIEAARRGASVHAVDLSPTLIAHARERLEGGLADELPGHIEFAVGDMLAPDQPPFDHVVAMDSIIHYEPEDALEVIAGLAGRAKRSALVTFAPRTPLLAIMHVTGKLFPRGDRSPAIVPVSEQRLRQGISECIASRGELAGYRLGRTRRIAHGFYTSQALMLVRPEGER